MSTFFVIKISKFVNHVEDRGMSHYMKIRKVQNWTSVTVCFMTVLCDSKCCKLTFIFFQTHTNTYRKSKKATAGLFGDDSRPLPVRPSSGPLRSRGRASPITCLPLHGITPMCPNEMLPHSLSLRQRLAQRQGRCRRQTSPQHCCPSGPQHLPLTKSPIRKKLRLLVKPRVITDIIRIIKTFFSGETSSML